MRILHKIQSEYFYNWKDWCLLEIFEEVVDLLGITEVVATGEEVTDLQLALFRALSPQVLANPSLCRKLSILRIVIIKLMRLQFHINICNIKLNVKLAGIRFLPANPVDSSPYIVFNRISRNNNPSLFFLEWLLLLCQLVGHHSHHPLWRSFFIVSPCYWFLGLILQCYSTWRTRFFPAAFNFGDSEECLRIFIFFNSGSKWRNSGVKTNHAFWPFDLYLLGYSWFLNCWG